MKQTYNYLLLLILLLTGCSEPEDYSPMLRGSISGQVLTYNEYNEPESAEGVTIQVLGEGFILEGSTDGNGNYKIENVPYGKWTYLISKPGFRYHYKKDFNLSKQEEKLNFSISRAPSVYVAQADFHTNASSDIRANIVLNEAVPAGKEFSLVTYIGNTAEVSYEKYLLKSVVGYTSTGEKNLQLYPSITMEDLKNRYGFKSGDTVYFMVCPGAARIYGYWDGDEYKVDSGINPSLAFTFTAVVP